MSWRREPHIAEVKNLAAEHHVQIFNLLADDAGNLWVSYGEPRSDGHRTFHIYDRDGRPLARASTTVQGATIQAVSRDHLIVHRSGNIEVWPLLK